MDRTLTPRIAPLLALVLVLAAATPVAAHAELVSTNPEPAAELDAPPDEVVVTFDDELDPAASGLVVTDAAGTEVGAGEVDLTVAERNVLRGSLTIEEPGDYTVNWTATAGDGHAEEGSFTFTITGSTAEPSDTPDTAMDGADTRTALVALGLLFLATALGLGHARLAAAPGRPR